MVTTSMTIRGQGEFFSNDRLLKRVQNFQDEVEEDPNKYQAGVLIALAAEFTTYGLSEFDRLAKALNEKNFGDGNIPPIFVALLERYKGLWTQQIQTGFATARSSIEGKTMFGQPSQLVRLIRAIRGLFSKEEKVVAKNTTLKGMTRARTKASGERVRYSIGLAAYLRMLTRTLPMNFRRDYEQLFVRLETRAKLPADKLPGPDNEQLYLINAGHSEASCSTCLMCNGRVLTRSALDFATTMLSPPLFHPNAVLSGSLFASYGRLDEMVGADYKGPAVVLSAQGHTLTIGPNHPILTTRGMVKANEIKEGDQLVYDSRCELNNSDGCRTSPYFQKMPLVEDGFEALRFVFGTALIPSSGHDFHGDRKFCEGEVKIVVPTRSLLPVLDPCGIKKFREHFLSRAAVQAVIGSGNGPSSFDGQGIDHASASFVGCALPSVFRILHVDTISTVEFSGKAFDATTETGLYFSNGFVVSNCRHAVLPSLKATEKSYDEVEGEIVTVATINGWIRAGKVKRASNPSPRTVNV